MTTQNTIFWLAVGNFTNYHTSWHVCSDSTASSLVLVIVRSSSIESELTVPVRDSPFTCSVSIAAITEAVPSVPLDKSKAKFSDVSVVCVFTSVTV